MRNYQYFCFDLSVPLPPGVILHFENPPALYRTLHEFSTVQNRHVECGASYLLDNSSLGDLMYLCPLHLKDGASWFLLVTNQTEMI